MRGTAHLRRGAHKVVSLGIHFLRHYSRHFPGPFFQFPENSSLLPLPQTCGVGVVQPPFKEHVSKAEFAVTCRPSSPESHLARTAAHSSMRLAGRVHPWQGAPAGPRRTRDTRHELHAATWNLVHTPVGRFWRCEVHTFVVSDLGPSRHLVDLGEI